MNRLRVIRRVALAALAVFALTRPATAQTEVVGDTIYVKGDKVVVVQSDEDGKRIVIRGFGDEDGNVFFNSDDGEGFFDVRPGTFKWRGPRALEFHGQHGEGDRNVAILNDYLDQMGNVWVDHDGADFRFGFGESMKGRSEVMKMERESRRLARQARQAEGDERDRLEAELEQHLQQIFERKQALREEEIDRMREALDKALDAHNERSSNRAEIIERRLRQLLGKEDKYDW